jgi:hypothetical protein
VNLPVTALYGPEDVCNAREHGLLGNGLTNDQPALAALVARLGSRYANDHRPRVIYCPPGEYLIADATTVWASGVALVARALDRAGRARETVPPQQRKAPNITRRQSAILLKP